MSHQVIAVCVSLCLRNLVFSADALSTRRVDEMLRSIYELNGRGIGDIIAEHLVDFHGEKVGFYVYSNMSGNFTVTPSNVNEVKATRPTKVLIHGWQTSVRGPFVRSLVPNLLRKGYVVVVVNWDKYANLGYIAATSCVPPTAAVVASFVANITRNSDGTNPSTSRIRNVHVIGHSLGAHVAGYAGQIFLNATGKRLHRITGVDPAGPIFEVPVKVSRGSRLSDDDAEHVDVIHSNAGLLGFAAPCGTADFYPNDGGPFQPGCGENLSCSHARSYLYYAESLVSDGFRAVQCNNSRAYDSGACDDNEKVLMGEKWNGFDSGSYYLRTNAEAPFAKG